MIQNERDCRHEHVLDVARQMLTAARTAPKGKGIDVIEAALVTGEDIKKLSEKMVAMVVEHGMKFFIREAVNVAGFACRNAELRRTGTAAVSYANSMVPMTVVIGYVNYAIVAVAGGMLCIKGLADVGALASYLVFVRQAAMPINQFTQLGNFLLIALAGAERLFAAMDLEPEVDEGCVELVQTGDAAWAW